MPSRAVQPPDHAMARGSSHAAAGEPDSPHGSSGTRSRSPGKVEARFRDLVRRQQSARYKYPLKLPKAQLKDLVGDSEDLRQEVVRNAEDAYPVMHRRSAKLANTFLRFKKEHGNDIERAVYDELHLDDLVSRLLVKRPLVFRTEFDDFLLRDGRTRGRGGFEKIGTEYQKLPLVLSDYQSYDEMEVSSLIGMTSPTPFISSGGRANCGVPAEPKSRYIRKGVFVGLVGARLDKENVMERKHFVVTREQNTTAKGYGEAAAKSRPLLHIFAKLYGIDWFCTYEEAVLWHGQGLRFVKFDEEDAYFDCEAYRGRCEILAETFVAEAHERVARCQQQTKAFCHVIGLGLGPGQVCSQQGQIQVDAYATALRRLDLPAIGELYFSGFEDTITTCGGVRNGEELETGAGTRVRVFFGDRAPAQSLHSSLRGSSSRLLVAQYEWNANCYPGNEYWLEKLDASDQAAAACCSCIATLQNPDVNREAFEGDRVALLPHPSAKVSPVVISSGADRPITASSTDSAQLAMKAGKSAVRSALVHDQNAIEIPGVGPTVWDGCGEVDQNITDRPFGGQGDADAVIKHSLVMKNRRPPPQPAHPPQFPGGLEGTLARLELQKDQRQQETERNDPNPWERGGCGTLSKGPVKRDNPRVRFDQEWKAKHIQLSPDCTSASCRRQRHGGFVMSFKPVRRRPCGRWFEVLVEEVDPTRWNDGLGIGLAALPDDDRATKRSAEKGQLEGYAVEVLPKSWMIGYDGRVVLLRSSRYVGGNDVHQLWPNMREQKPGALWRPRHFRPGDVVQFLATPEGSLLLFLNDELVYHVRRCGVPWSGQLHATLDLDGCTQSVHFLESDGPSKQILYIVARIRAEEEGRPFPNDPPAPLSLCYDIAKERLIRECRYPEELLQELKGFDPAFEAAPPLAADTENCAVCRINAWCRVSAALFGREQVDPRAAEEIYDGPAKASQIYEWSWRFRSFSDKFGAAEACLLADIVHWFRARRVPFDPNVLVDDVLRIADKAGQEAEARTLRERQEEYNMQKMRKEANLMYRMLTNSSPTSATRSGFASPSMSRAKSSTELRLMSSTDLRPTSDNAPGRTMLVSNSAGRLPLISNSAGR